MTGDNSGLTCGLDANYSTYITGPGGQSAVFYAGDQLGFLASVETPAGLHNDWRRQPMK